MERVFKKTPENKSADRLEGHERLNGIRQTDQFIKGYVRRFNSGSQNINAAAFF